MKTEKTDRGFIVVVHERHQSRHGKMTRLIQESSAIGDYENSFDCPGSSYLWIGHDHHLNREEVTELVARMQYWLKTGRLKTDNDDRRYLERQR